MARRKLTPEQLEARREKMRIANKLKYDERKEQKANPIPEHIMMGLHRRWSDEPDIDNSTMHTGGGDDTVVVPSTEQPATDERSTIQRVLRSAGSSEEQPAEV